MPVRPSAMPVARRTRCASPAESVAGGPVEREVAEAGVGQPLQAGDHVAAQVGHRLAAPRLFQPRVQPFEEREAVAHRQRLQLGDVPAGHANRERVGLEAGAAARGAWHRVHERLERGAAVVGVLALVLLPDAPDQADPLRLEPVHAGRAPRAGSATRRRVAGRPCRAGRAAARGRRAAPTATEKSTPSACPAARSVATCWPSRSP